MAIEVISCPPPGYWCSVYAFSGFQNTKNKYASIAFCDWDCCLASPGITGDFVDAGDLGVYYQPNSWPTMCGQFEEDKVNCCESSNPDGRVDGHFVFTAISTCYAKITESTGLYADYFPMDTIATIDYVNYLTFVFGNEEFGVRTTESDHLSYAGGYGNFYCGQSVLGTAEPPDTLCFPMILIDPSPNNS